MNIRSLFRSFSTLQIALGVSVAVHAALLSVRFIDPEGFNRVFQDTPLEVILVNAKSTERPEKAQAIAQSNLAGGGDAAQGIQFHHPRGRRRFVTHPVPLTRHASALTTPTAPRGGQSRAPSIPLPPACAS